MGLGKTRPGTRDHILITREKYQSRALEHASEWPIISSFLVREEREDKCSQTS